MGCVLARKRIYNPRTRTYYKVAERSGSRHRRGQIMGLWSSKKRKRRSSSILDLI